MPFETFGLPPRRIAVIGGGISGMAAAHLLAADHAVTLFEAERRLGGHARTVYAGKLGDQPVDTGFIVFNKVNYPHLTALFDRLRVPVTESSMTFGASIAGGRLEYGLRTLDSLFAQRRNAANPRFLGMLRDILRFNRHGVRVAEATPGQTIGDFLDRLGTGDWFRDHYITPLSGAIWSTPTRGILDFPAHAMIRFFQNHALMNVSNQHQWYTVQGGSTQYVTRLQAELTRQGVEVRTGAPVAALRREQNGILLRPHGGEWELYDEVVLATHSDISLAMLSDARPEERAALSAVRYQPNEATLHSDASVMPRSRKVWSAWNYVEAAGPRPDRIDLTYWMNALQPIPQDDPLFVTLNATGPIRAELIHDQVTFHHPVYDHAAIAAQSAVRGFNGAQHTWFCGAWMRDGFHEDGFASAVAVVEALRSRMALRVAA